MKTIHLILIGLLLSLSTQAQLAKSIQFGLKAGINYNKLKGKNFQSAMQQDWHLGGYMQMRGEKISLGLEAIYDRGRYEMKNLVVDAVNYHYLGDTSENNVMLQAHKFQIPMYLMYKIKFFHVMLGAVYELNVHMKDKEEFIRDTKNSFENSYPSIMTGVWLDVTKNINIGARYQMGMQNVNTTHWNTQWRSREAQIHLGIKL